MYCQETMPARSPLSQPFHHHQHLLIQFILAELIAAQVEVNAAFELLKKNPIPKSEESKQLNTHLNNLSGGTHVYERLLSWNDDGILTKLKSYCNHFSERAKEKSKDRNNMVDEAHQAWLTSLQVLQTARARSSIHANEANERTTFDVLNEPLQKIVRCLQRLTRLAAKVLPEFRHDENVIFFLVRHAQDLDNVCGEQFVGKLLRKMFPKRVNKGIDTFLIKKYSERGFKHLIPVIQSKLETMHIYNES